VRPRPPANRSGSLSRRPPTPCWLTATDPPSSIWLFEPNGPWFLLRLECKCQAVVPRTPDIGRALRRAWVGFDLVAQDEVAAGMLAPVAVVWQETGPGPWCGGERFEPDERFAKMPGGTRARMAAAVGPVSSSSRQAASTGATRTPITWLVRQVA
jgi:hypothetical protein